MGGFLLFAVFLQGLIFGFFSSYIAGEKNRDKFGWFMLGLFFSILAVLALIAIPKIENKVKLTAVPSGEFPLFDGNRDITSPQYQLFLTKQYSIEKNLTLEKFVIGNVVFNTLDDSLSDANTRYARYLSEKANKERVAAEEAKAKAYELEGASKKDEERQKSAVMIVSLALVVVIGYGIWHSKHQEDVYPPQDMSEKADDAQARALGFKNQSEMEEFGKAQK
ncbi:hypothetical protein [Polaromonas hydrogenivorans]|uniref:Uncharacterized protein n=1 Tax=Polaromonas hydrogenivorans TaxID=335476 RepID=A0AAU7LT16_9BURK